MHDDLKRLLVTTSELSSEVAEHVESLECVRLDTFANWAESVEESCKLFFAGTQLGSVANKAKNEVRNQQSAHYGGPCQ